MAFDQAAVRPFSTIRTVRLVSIVLPKPFYRNDFNLKLFEKRIPPLKAAISLKFSGALAVVISKVKL